MESEQSAPLTTVTSTVTRSLSTENTAVLVERTRWMEVVVSTVMGILVIAFCAWSLILWNASIAAKDLLQGLNYKVDAIGEHIVRVEGHLREHEALEAHAGALKLHTLEMERIQHMQTDLEALKLRELQAHDDHGRPRRE